MPEFDREKFFRELQPVGLHLAIYAVVALGDIMLDYWVVHKFIGLVLMAHMLILGFDIGMHSSGLQFPARESFSQYKPYDFSNVMSFPHLFVTCICGILTHDIIYPVYVGLSFPITLTMVASVVSTIMSSMLFNLVAFIPGLMVGYIFPRSITY